MFRCIYGMENAHIRMVVACPVRVSNSLLRQSKALLIAFVRPFCLMSSARAVCSCSWLSTAEGLPLVACWGSTVTVIVRRLVKHLTRRDARLAAAAAAAESSSTAQVRVPLIQRETLLFLAIT